MGVGGLPREIRGKDDATNLAFKAGLVTQLFSGSFLELSLKRVRGVDSRRSKHPALQMESSPTHTWANSQTYTRVQPKLLRYNVRSLMYLTGDVLV